MLESHPFEMNTNTLTGVAQTEVAHGDNEIPRRPRPDGGSPRWQRDPPPSIPPKRGNLPRTACSTTAVTSPADVGSFLAAALLVRSSGRGACTESTSGAAYELGAEDEHLDVGGDVNLILSGEAITGGGGLFRRKRRAISPHQERRPWCVLGAPDRGERQRPKAGGQRAGGEGWQEVGGEGRAMEGAPGASGGLRSAMDHD